MYYILTPDTQCFLLYCVCVLACARVCVCQTRWMMAADYFMSARARGLRIPPGLDALGTATIRHLTWRFGRFYRDRTMIKTMAGCDRWLLGVGACMCFVFVFVFVLGTDVEGKTSVRHMKRRSKV